MVRFLLKRASFLFQFSILRADKALYAVGNSLPHVADGRKGLPKAGRSQNGGRGGGSLADVDVPPRMAARIICSFWNFRQRYCTSGCASAT